MEPNLRLRRRTSCGRRRVATRHVSPALLWLHFCPYFRSSTTRNHRYYASTLLFARSAALAVTLTPATHPVHPPRLSQVLSTRIEPAYPLQLSASRLMLELIEQPRSPRCVRRAHHRPCRRLLPRCPALAPAARSSSRRARPRRGAAQARRRRPRRRAAASLLAYAAGARRA